MIKDIDDWPDEEIPRARSGEVPSAGSSAPWSLGPCPPGT